MQITRAAAAPNAADTVTFKVSVAELPPVSSNETIEVMLALTESELSSNVSRGENSGRRLEHGSVVRQLALMAQADSRDTKTIKAESSVKLAREWKFCSELRVTHVREIDIVDL